MKYIIILVDYLLAFIVLGLFLWLTPFGTGWSPFTDKLFLFAVFVGMTLGQLLFPPKFSRENINSEHILRNVLAVSITFIVGTYITIMALDRPGSNTGRWLVPIGVVFFVLFLVLRWAEKRFLQRVWTSGRNVLQMVAIGHGGYFKKIVGDINKNPASGFHITGCYTDDDVPLNTRKLGTMDDALEIIRLYQHFPGAIGGILCGLPTNERDTIKKVSHYCDRYMLRFFYSPAEDTILRLRLKPVIINDDEMFTSVAMPLSNPFNRFVKRAFDVMFSSLVLLCLCPFIPIIALIIKLQSPGPIFFKQARTGMDGRTFMCYKFRSMHVNKQADTMQATKDDPRKFAFGNFMRKCNIDELPQFWNVLINDMSIVGPRPHMLKHTEMYRKLLSQYMVRHFVKPGITGWAQVSGFRGETKELWQMEGRVNADIWYIEHWSFWLDMRIIWLTFKSIFIHDKHAY